MLLRFKFSVNSTGVRRNPGADPSSQKRLVGKPPRGSRRAPPKSPLGGPVLPYRGSSTGMRSFHPPSHLSMTPHQFLLSPSPCPSPAANKPQHNLQRGTGHRTIITTLIDFIAISGAVCVTRILQFLQLAAGTHPTIMFSPHAQPSTFLSQQITPPSCAPDDGFRRRRGYSLQCSSPCRCELRSSLKRSREIKRNMSHGLRAQADSGGVVEQTDSNDTRKELFEVAANNILREGDLGQKSFLDSGSNDGRLSENGAASPDRESKAKEQEMDWEKAPTTPENLDLAQQHPLDPHKPNFSELLPEPLRPYPSFEGWFVRIWDPKQKLSVAVILATNYATDESQVTLLFAPGKNVDNDGSRDRVKHGYTYAVAAKTKDAKFSTKENNDKWGDNRGEKPQGFEWEMNGIGCMIVTPHNTDLDFNVEGYHFKALLTNELLWDAHKSEKGPEGWIRYVSIVPTHWYVYSLGSTVNYSFSNLEKGIHNEGSAFGHVEKNWGQTFPAGHVWLQAFSSDNTSQVCCTGAYFKSTSEKLSSPYLYVLGYRSPKLQLDFRSNDLGIVFKDSHFAARDSRFSITAVGPSHSVEVNAFAPYDTFSESVLAPVSKIDWEPACRESYVATVEIKVYEHLAWGIPGTKNLVETQKFEFAALEFGEDLLTEGSEDSEASGSEDCFN